MKTQRKKQRSENLEPVYMRLPRDIKERLEAEAELRGVSKAALAADILDRNLGGASAKRVSEWLAKLS